MKEGEQGRTAMEEFRSGWKILLAALVGCGLGVTSLPLYTAGVFFPALEAEFGWTRTEISFAITLFTFSLALSSPVVGVLVDRLGVKRTAALSIVFAAVCYAAIAQFLAGLPFFYAAHVAIAVLGAAAAPVAYTRVVVNHFVRARGLALGITLLGPSLVAAVAPTVLVTVITDHGWAVGYLVIAAAILSVLAFLPLLGREEPAATKHQNATNKPVTMFPSSESRSIFATLMGAIALFSLGIGGLIVHLVPMLVDEGISAQQAAQIAGLIGLSGIVGRLVGGALADRIFAPFILIGVALLAALGCLFFALGSLTAAIIATPLIGFALGVEADLMGYLVSRYFPREAYGRVFGWQYAMFISGVGIGPLILGKVRDKFGTYDPALFGCVVLLLLAAALFHRLPRFEKP